MSPELIDILPFERRRAWRRDYVLRLTALTAFLLFVLVMVAGVLLIPTYVFLTGETRTKQARLTSIESNLSSADQTALALRLSALQAAAATLLMLAKGPSVSALLRNTLLIPHPGVTLTGFSYTPGVGAKPGTLTITGVAANRNTLRAYQLACSNQPAFASADLPVSSYAKERDIPFTISAKLTPSP